MTTVVVPPFPRQEYAAAMHTRNTPAAESRHHPALARIAGIDVAASDGEEPRAERVVGEETLPQTFHPAIRHWFARHFPAPTPAQAAAWPVIARGENALVAAPTGSGKTLTGFLSALNDLVERGQRGGLPDAVQVVYVSPLKALSNDIAINLEAPLTGITEELFLLGQSPVEIRTAVRTGDTPQSERTAQRRLSPHILVTTPESLYVLLGSESGRAMLRDVRSVIVDEIHALYAGKRGSHLMLSLERLEALCEKPFQRIGLSATQKPIEAVADFLCGDAQAGGNARPCTIIDTGHVRDRDLALELPPIPLTPVMANETWETVYDRLAQLANEHRTTLIFVNTRRMAERAVRHLALRLGKEAVAAHHGSLAKELRFDAEQKLKRGQLRALVATASLELGIDIGDVDLVCQIGSPRAISTFLQRVGRAGHAVGATPKGRLFPTSRDELVECAALLHCVACGELDALILPPQPLDVLSQQIVAEVAAREWIETELFNHFRRAMPYRNLKREQFDAVLKMLAEGYTTRVGTRGAYLHRDRIENTLRARRGARLTAISSGGTIPDTADYQVILEPQGFVIGSVHEDFAVESLAGDVFQLGNASYRILKIEAAGKLRVEDAQGAPPSIPFWIGEAPGRSEELSFGVSRLREAVACALDEGGIEAAARWLCGEARLDERAARELAEYLCEAKIALGFLPMQSTLGMERFFDESGAMQLVIHSPFGNRINKAWGLALRKRFCRSFNFELQAAATDDAIVLSLSTSHSFPLDEVGRYLHSGSAKDILVQALLDAPLFPVRWRWNAVNALALPRMAGGRKLPPQVQRMRSEDLLASVFPDQVACLENIVGDRQIPDHPLVEQTLRDCLHEAMDVDGFLALLRRLESGAARIEARDLTAPSPLAAEILNARPYAFLDDAPLEERRTRAVQTRRIIDPATAEDLGKLDADAIAAVREDAWPQAINRDEMHEALLASGFLTPAEADANVGWNGWLAQLAKSGHAARVSFSEHGGENETSAWIAAERLPQFLAIFPNLSKPESFATPAGFDESWTREAAMVELLRGRLGALGPCTAQSLAQALELASSTIEVALATLETEGTILRGRFTPDATQMQWCERRLLARIHRATLSKLRREIEPVEPKDYLRFLFEWQRVSANHRVKGPEALAGVLAQLEGFEAPAAAWESTLLPARVADYQPSWLDDLCLAGRTTWQRLRPNSRSNDEPSRPATSLHAAPIVLLPRRQRDLWRALAAGSEAAPLTGKAQKLADWLTTRGASFFDEMLDGVRLLRPELEEALAELVARGRIVCDSWAGLRALLTSSKQRERQRARHPRRSALFGIEDAGRWSLVAKTPASSAEASSAQQAASERAEAIARILLRRWGVVGWHQIEREADWLPTWRDILRALRTLEARGEIRGGRFIAGVSGEQFALPEAIAALRRVRNAPLSGELVCISGVDPLNLSGGLIVGPKVPRVVGARLLFRDGLPIATRIADNIEWLDDLEPAEQHRAQALLRGDLLPAAAQIARPDGLRPNPPVPFASRSP